MLMGLLLMTAALTQPIVIAHRGASGERPEHTLASYELAIDQGADFIEPDLVATKDGMLVARHENEIAETTDVSTRPEFAARRATKTIDGRAVTGWFTEDFTLAELRTLRARERLPQLRPQSAKFDGQFGIATFAEVIALAKRRGVGVYPETKHPSYFRAIGLPLEDRLLADLAEAGWRDAAAPVFIQSFEVGNLQTLRPRTSIRLVQLIDAGSGPADRADLSPAAMTSPVGLRAIVRYADAIGVAKALIVPRDAGGRSLPRTTLTADAHAAGLKVHVWTFRAENFFLPAERRVGSDAAAAGDVAGELVDFYAAGVDGVFSDFPGIAVSARAKLPSPAPRSPATR